MMLVPHMAAFSLLSSSKIFTNSWLSFRFASSSTAAKKAVTLALVFWVLSSAIKRSYFLRSRRAIKMIRANTNRRWISEPAMWREKPPSQARITTMRTISRMLIKMGLVDCKF